MIVLAVLTLAVTWALNHPSAIVHTFHITTATPGLDFIKKLYGPLKIPTILTLVGITALVFIATWTWRELTWYAIENDYLVFRIGPFAEDRIPIGKIQNVNMNRGLLAMMLGYGTLLIDSGREEESLSFVPDIKEFADQLQSGHTRTY